VRSDANLLEEDCAGTRLENTQGFQHHPGTADRIYRCPNSRLKDFFNEFFDRPPSATEARELGKETGKHSGPAE
jgi:hypothetical protein